MNRTYELVVILDPEVTAEDQEKLLTKIKSLISDAEGKTFGTKEWGKKELVFPISKRKTGIFYILDFSASTTSIPSLRQKLTLEEKILRYLLVIKTPSASASVKTAADKKTSEGQGR